MNNLRSKTVFLRPRIAQFFAILGISAGATMFYYENSFIFYPDAPDVSVGRTVSYTVKFDLVRYVTPFEAFIGHASHYVLFASGAIFGILVFLEMKKRGVWFKSES